MAAAQCALRWAAGADLMVLAGSVRGAGKWAAQLASPVSGQVCVRHGHAMLWQNVALKGLPGCDGM